MAVLTVIAGAELVLFLGALGWRLRGVSESLQNVTITMEKITAGVRAIEQQTAPLTAEVTRLNEGLAELSAEFESAQRALGRLAS